MITKSKLDKLVKKYENIDFIKNDPIQFPHLGKNTEEIELYGFIASLFAYGNRKIFIKKLSDIFYFANNDIVGFIKNGKFDCLSNTEYRFSKPCDIIPIFEILSVLYNESNGLSELFKYAKAETNEINLQFWQVITDYFYARAPKTVKSGFYHMLPNPQNGGAMKRMNMFLRWMVRKPPVDFGIWDFIKPKELLIPLDVHVARLSRQMGLLKRKSNDYKAVLKLTENLRKFDCNDPVKYDFAMFAFDVEFNNKEEMINE